MYKIILNKILLSEKPSEGIYKLMATGELDNVIPELLRLTGFDQQTPYHDKDVLEHTLAVVDEIKPKLKLRMAALLHDISKPDCFTVDERGRGHFYGHHIRSAQISEKILQRLGYEDEFITDVKTLIRYHYIKDIANIIKEKGIKKFVEAVGAERLDDMFELIRADMTGKASTNYEIIEKLKNMCEDYLEKRS
ncbi:MAG: HD domain-containing protein [Tissierellia bacterium]|jgi:tRNA nucleotidyltransferase (CCA-adding enzyme)|nr:HD domain-containing protein [Tissierellia bacterium]